MARKEKIEYLEDKARDDIKVRMYPPEDGRASASLAIELKEGGTLYVKGTAFEGKKGYFFSFPSYKKGSGKNSEYVDLVFPDSKDIRDAINDTLDNLSEKF